MVIGSRIELRRQDLGISQAELARRVGIRQSTMHSLITGASRSSRSITRIARELRTTPAYLVGDIDDPDSGALDVPSLPSDQQELVDAFRHLSQVDRVALLQIAKSMAGKSNGGTVHTPRREFRGEHGG